MESIILVTVLIVFVVVFNSYFSLIKKKNKIQEAFSRIDLQLIKRYDVISNILSIAKKSMEHEKYIFEEVAQMRSRALKLSDNFSNIDEKICLASEIAKKMEQIIALVRNCPQLRSNQSMLTTMRVYDEIEARIVEESGFYNSAVYELKNAVEKFPSLLIAPILNIRATGFFLVQKK